MAHEIEIVNGVAQMAYAGQKPWHGLGTEVPADLTPVQMLEVAGLDWEVTKVPLYGRIGMSEVQAASSFSFAIATARASTRYLMTGIQSRTQRLSSSSMSSWQPVTCRWRQPAP